MKRTRHLLVASLLALTCTIVGCTTEANPSNASTNLVEITDGGNNYFQNNYAKIFFELEKSGNLNTTTFSYVANQLAEDDIGDFFGDEATLKGLKADLILEKLLDLANKDDYKIDKVFSEQLYINNLASKGYIVNVSETKEQIYVTSETEVYQMLTLTTETDDKPNYDQLLNGPYGDYIKKELVRLVNQELVTAKFICQKYFSALGRAYAREAQYVALPNAKKLQAGQTGDFVNAWLKAALKEDGSSGATINLSSLAKVYRGTETELTGEEATFTSSNEVSLLSNLKTELEEVADYDTGNGSWTMRLDEKINPTVEQKYTNSNKYSLDVGYELAKRDIKVQNLYKKDLFTKTKGISDLPTSITERLFSSSVENYLQDVTITGSNKKLLTRQDSEAGSTVEKCYFYDKDKDTYYIVLVEDSKYSSTDLKEHVEFDASQKAIRIKDTRVAKVALELYSESYKKEAITYLLEKAGLKDTIHDDRFYTYMKENYGDIFD